MTEVRTRVSGNYIRPNNTCPVNPSPTCTTRTRVSGDYVKSSGIPYCGRTVYTSPSYRYTPSYFFSTPRTVYTAPAVSQVRGTRLAEDIAGVFLLSALVVGVVALAAIAPRCYKEEVCTETMGAMFKTCHLEEVCRY